MGSASGLAHESVDGCLQVGRVVLTIDVGDNAFAVDDHVEREGGDGAALGKRAVRVVVVPADREAHACLIDEALDDGRIVAAEETALVDADDDRPLLLVLAPDVVLEVWKLQTADRSEGGEVGQHDHLALLLGQ